MNRIIDGTPEVQLIDQLRGLAIIPGEQNNRLIGFDLEDEKSKFVLYGFCLIYCHSPTPPQPQPNPNTTKSWVRHGNH